MIKGGPPLSGEIIAAGNKNAALPILAACLLTDEEVVLTNVPRIRDTETQIAVLEGLGVRAEWRPDNELRLRADVGLRRPRSTRGSRRGSGPRSCSPARCWRASARRGCRRRAATSSAAAGSTRTSTPSATWAPRSRAIARSRSRAPPGGLKPCAIFMDEPSVMATENALMAAALTPGPTTIANAACEPHVQDLARLLVKMGAQIDGIGSNVMTVHGRDKLGGAEHRICADHIEVASFMALAAATGGELRIRDAEPDDLITIRRHFRRLGLQSMVEGNDVLVPPDQTLEVRDDLGDAIPKIDDGPWPAFPADLTSIALALATQARGTILIFEKMFENRLFFVDKLVAMGARITLCDPHRAIVSGPSRLHGERVESPDIRAGMAMLIAALCADGTSEIGNVVQIDRGYERIDERLRDARRADRARRGRAGAGLRRDGSAVAAVRHVDRIRRRLMTHPIPPGTRDILPDEMRELRRLSLALIEVFERFGYGEVATPTIEYEEVLARGDERGAPVAYRFFDESRRAAGDALRHDDPDRPPGRQPLRRRGAAVPALLPGARLPRGAPAARPDARVHPGRGRADRRRRRRRAPPRWSRCSPRRSTPPG